MYFFASRLNPGSLILGYLNISCDHVSECSHLYGCPELRMSFLIIRKIKRNLRETIILKYPIFLKIVIALDFRHWNLSRKWILASLAPNSYALLTSHSSAGNIPITLQQPRRMLQKDYYSGQKNNHKMRTLSVIRRVNTNIQHSWKSHLCSGSKGEEFFYKLMDNCFICVFLMCGHSIFKDVLFFSYHVEVCVYRHLEGEGTAYAQPPLCCSPSLYFQLMSFCKEEISQGDTT